MADIQCWRCKRTPREDETEWYIQAGLVVACPECMDSFYDPDGVHREWSRFLDERIRKSLEDRIDIAEGPV